MLADLIQRSKQLIGRSYPAGQRCTIEGETLANMDLRLAIKRQVITIL